MNLRGLRLFLHCGSNSTMQLRLVRAYTSQYFFKFPFHNIRRSITPNQCFQFHASFNLSLAIWLGQLIASKWAHCHAPLQMSPVIHCGCSRFHFWSALFLHTLDDCIPHFISCKHFPVTCSLHPMFFIVLFNLAAKSDESCEWVKGVVRFFL